MSQTLCRAQIEKLVRSSLLRQQAGGAVDSKPTAGPNPLIVNSSARFCHLTQEAVETLFGKGHRLNPMKWLYQEGPYAAEGSVNLIAPP